MSGSDLFKQNADDCRQRSVEAGTAYEKADWFELAEEWQKLANAIDGINAQPRAPVIVGNSIRLASDVESGDALG